MKIAALLTTLLLCAIAVLHVMRLVFQVQISAGSVAIPMWASVVAVPVATGLALGLWREQRE